MSIFSLVPFPEDIGIDVQESVVLRGAVFDIEGNPVELDVFAGLNSLTAQYKTQFGLKGDPRVGGSSPVDGSWSAELPDTSNMRADSYYRITLNGRIFRKVLPDFPLERTLNELEDYS